MSDIVPAPAVVEKKSWVQQFVDRARGEIKAAPPASAVSYVRETGSTIGEYAEGGLVGSILGATHAKFGLDTKGGPIDGWISGLGAIAAVGLSGYWPNAAAHARKIGRDAFVILTFRKGYETVNHAPLPGGASSGVQRINLPGSSPASAVDPIEEAAKGLG